MSSNNSINPKSDLLSFFSMQRQNDDSSVSAGNISNFCDNKVSGDKLKAEGYGGDVESVHHMFALNKIDFIKGSNLKLCNEKELTGHEDKSQLFPVSLVKKKDGSVFPKIPPSLLNEKNKNADVEFVKNGRVVHVLRNDKFEFSTYSADQLIRVNDLFNKKMNKLIKDLEIHKKEEKENSLADKCLKLLLFKEIKKNQKSETKEFNFNMLKKKQALFDMIMSSMIRREERIKKEREKNAKEFAKEIDEYKTHTEELKEYRLVEDIDKSLNEKDLYRQNMRINPRHKKK